MEDRVRYTIRVGFGKKLCNIPRAVGPGGIKLHTAGGFGNRKFIKFPEMPYKEYGLSVLNPDNASYHHSTTVKKFLESMGGRIIMPFTPSYTPQVNSTEIQDIMQNQLFAHALGTDFQNNCPCE